MSVTPGPPPIAWSAFSAITSRFDGSIALPHARPGGRLVRSGQHGTLQVLAAAGPIGTSRRLEADTAISVRRRFSLVSSRFALITNQTAIFR